MYPVAPVTEPQLTVTLLDDDELAVTPDGAPGLVATPLDAADMELSPE
jgi:hypothetical protein